MSAKQLQEIVEKTQDSDSLMAVFRNTIPNCRYNFKSGKEAVFMNGQYLTNNKTEIEELMAEIDSGHPNIFLNREEMFKETKYVDPVWAIKEQLMKDLRASGMLIENGGMDYGTSDQNVKMNINTSRAMAEAMGGMTVSSQGAFPVPGPANVSMVAVPAMNTIGVDSTHPHVADSTQAPVNMSVAENPVVNQEVSNDELKDKVAAEVESLSHIGENADKPPAIGEHEITAVTNEPDGQVAKKTIVVGKRTS